MVTVFCVRRRNWRSMVRHACKMNNFEDESASCCKVNMHLVEAFKMLLACWQLDRRLFSHTRDALSKHLTT
jgi:hypothetical protein